MGVRVVDAKARPLDVQPPQDVSVWVSTPSRCVASYTAASTSLDEVV